MKPSIALGELTTHAIAIGWKLKVIRNRGGSFTAEVFSPCGAAIAGTMPTPGEALTQLEQALHHELNSTPTAV